MYWFPVHEIEAISDMDLESKYCYFYHSWDFVPYQLYYFICIKDLTTETITSLKLNLLSFFICCYQHHETKTICLYIFQISDRYCSTKHQYLFSRFLGVSILHLFISYRIYDYEMLTLSQK
jgi:hypothetical protein